MKELNLFLVGAKALINCDLILNQIVFDNFLGEKADIFQVVNRYFETVYNYLLMISKPILFCAWGGFVGC